MGKKIAAGKKKIVRTVRKIVREVVGSNTKKKRPRRRTTRRQVVTTSPGSANGRIEIMVFRLVNRERKKKKGRQTFPGHQTAQNCQEP